MFEIISKGVVLPKRGRGQLWQAKFLELTIYENIVFENL